jgi:hypothetical protein
MKIKLDCPQGFDHHNGEHDDYYPLTKKEIADLLSQAARVSATTPADFQTIAGIQCRLGQGIVGHTCPHPIDGPVAEALAQLDEYYARNYYLGARPEMVDELYRIMHLPEHRA